MNITRKIRVLVVDDSMVFRETIIRGLSNDPSIEVVGGASDAFMARDKIIELAPDVMTLDFEMPKMNGIEFLKKLMPQYPLPVVMVTGLDKKIFDALNAGAVDFVNKPEGNSKDDLGSFINELIIKVKIASTAKVGHFKRASAELIQSDKKTAADDMIIAIGASTGGTEAIFEVVKSFPIEIPGIVIVQHMPPVFTKMYADRLNNTCKIEVKEATDGDIITPGKALIAPGGFQLKVMKDRKNYYVKVFEGERVNGHAPSVDVMFNSVAEVVKEKAVGVILTGMGNDGAKGLLNMRKSGAFTVGQDEKSCVVYGMPMVAYNIGAVTKQCSLSAVGSEVMNYLRTVKSM